MHSNISGVDKAFSTGIMYISEEKHLCYKRGKKKKTVKDDKYISIRK